MTTITAAAPIRVPAGRDRARLRTLFGWASPLFWVCCIAYLAIGCYLNLARGLVVGDALSRVENAAAVLWSRDPHLAAIGFVWPPLPSAAALPLVSLDGLWHGLVSFAIAGVIETSVVMAVAVEQLRRCCRDLGASARVSTVIAAVFAVNPLIAYYGSNGMTEAWLICFLVAGTRRLVRWIDGGRTTDLALAGIFPALAYLCRYEALAAGLGCSVLVVAVSFRRAAGTRGERVRQAAATALVPAFPVAFVFAFWALTSWIIVGQPFEQFTSRYGNSAELRAQGGTTAMVHGSLVHFVLSRTVDVAPLLLLAAVACLVSCVRRRDPRVLGVVAVIGGTVAAMDGLLLAQMTFPWLRFHILLIPMSGLLVAAACAGTRGRGRNATAWLLVGALTLAIPTTWRALVSRNYWAEPLLSYGLWHRNDDTTYWLFHRVAEQLDAEDLPDGSVLTDLSNTYGIVAASRRPRQFVIPADRDFGRAFADPPRHVEYLLAVRHGLGDTVDVEIQQLRQRPRRVIAPVFDLRGTGSPANWMEIELWRVVKR